MNDRSLLEQVLQAWRVKAAINLKLVSAIPKKGFDAVPLASRGRTVAKQLSHMQKVQAGWLRYNGARLSRDARPLHRNTTLHRKRLATTFHASGAAVETFLRERLQSGERIKFFQGKALRSMRYLIAHDSRHRGQIALALKQNGMPLPENLALREVWLRQKLLSLDTCYHPRIAAPTARMLSMETSMTPFTPCDCWPTRRSFLKTAAAFAAGCSGVSVLAQPTAEAASPDESDTILGPKKGFTPEIGTLTSMMAFTRSQVWQSTKGLSTEQLDFLLDAKANRIGALLMHLAAIETFFQLNTFDGVKWGSWPDSIKQKWEVPGGLDEPARKAIQGHHLDYYLNLLTEIREKTLAEFRKRDDQWLMTVDKYWGWGPTNNYCKWFHVAEYESNHNGEIKLIKGRLPGAKSGNE